MSILDEAKIDCHCHVLDPARFPYDPKSKYLPSGQEVAPVDHFMRVMDLNGVRHALVVGTNSAYGEDLSPVLDAISQGNGRFKGIAVVANDIAGSELERLKASGIVGIAFNGTFYDASYYANTQELLRNLSALDMVLQLQVKEDQLLDFLPMIERTDVRLVIDHCGKPAPMRGVEQPGFQALLQLGRSGRASVKASGFSQFSRERYPYRDVHPFVDALIAAFTLDGCMWGSDWPVLRATERMDYGPLLQLLEHLVPNEPDRKKLLWETPHRVFGFGE
jgi:predicted TIM-barrel fold metal-dependent hydrolase